MRWCKQYIQVSASCLGRRSGKGASTRRRYVRFWGSPDLADYPPRLVYDANDPQRTLTVLTGELDLAC